MSHDESKLRGNFSDKIDVVDEQPPEDEQPLEAEISEKGAEITLNAEESAIIRGLDAASGADYIHVAMTCARTPSDEELERMSNYEGVLNKILRAAGWANELGMANFDFEIKPVSPHPLADGNVKLDIVYIISHTQTNKKYEA